MVKRLSLKSAVTWNERIVRYFHIFPQKHSVEIRVAKAFCKLSREGLRYAKKNFIRAYV